MAKTQQAFEEKERRLAEKSNSMVKKQLEKTAKDVVALTTPAPDKPDPKPQADDSGKVNSSVPTSTQPTSTQPNSTQSNSALSDSTQLSSAQLNDEIKKAEELLAETDRKLEAIRARKLFQIQQMKAEAEKKAVAEEEAKKAEAAKKAKEANEAKKKYEEAVKTASLRAAQYQTPLPQVVFPQITSPSSANSGFTGPDKVYRYYNYMKKEYDITSDFWAAEQAAPHAWKAIWVWRVNGVIHHEMDPEELSEYFPA